MHAYIHTFVMISHVHSPGVIGLPRQRKIQCRTHASKACCVGSARWCSYAVHALPFSFHAPFAFILSLHIRAKVHVLRHHRWQTTWNFVRCSSWPKISKNFVRSSKRDEQKYGHMTVHTQPQTQTHRHTHKSKMRTNVSGRLQQHRHTGK